MAANYQIELAFLELANPIPPFTVYRKERNLDSESLRDTCWGYSLPIADDNLENRIDYWVSLEARDDFLPFVVESTFNNELTKQALLKGLVASCSSHLEAHQFWVPTKGFLKEIHLNMIEHKEGKEQLVLQPYFLRSTKIFGLLVDFHFRVNEGIEYSRRVQQLSLALDKNGRRNVDFYADRFEKITSFLSARESLLANISIPGTQTALSFSKGFTSLEADRLNSRTYIFGNRGESKSQFQGLQTHGPLSPISQPPNLLFVFRERDRHAARDLATAIRGSNPRTRGRFFGFSSLFKTDLTIDTNPVVLSDYSIAEMTRALEAVKARPGALPILVMPQDEQAYLNHKAIFTHAMVPTQVCTLEVIQDESALKWSVGNIALQVFCKAGGIPWKVRPTSEKSLIIGISQSHKTKQTDNGIEVDKYFAFSVLTDSSGLFQRIEILSESDQEGTYLDQLKNSLSQVLLSSAQAFDRVVIHTSFKLKNREIATIRAVVKEISDSQSANACSFAVIKVNHSNRFFGFNKEVNSLVPFEGTVVRLGWNEFLVWFEGIYPDKHTVNKQFPGPTHLQFLEITDKNQGNERVLLQDLINLSGANWRGFNAKSAPVSVFYCHLVADLVHDFQAKGLPLPAVRDLRPWFL